MIIVLNTSDFSSQESHTTPNPTSAQLDSCPAMAEENQFLKQMEGWL